MEDGVEREDGAASFEVELCGFVSDGRQLLHLGLDVVAEDGADVLYAEEDDCAEGVDEHGAHEQPHVYSRVEQRYM